MAGMTLERIKVQTYTQRIIGLFDLPANQVLSQEKDKKITVGDFVYGQVGKFIANPGSWTALAVELKKNIASMPDLSTQCVEIALHEEFSGDEHDRIASQRNVDLLISSIKLNNLLGSASDPSKIWDTLFSRLKTIHLFQKVEVSKIDGSTGHLSDAGNLQDFKAPRTANERQMLFIFDQVLDHYNRSSGQGQTDYKNLMIKIGTWFGNWNLYGLHKKMISDFLRAKLKGQDAQMTTFKGAYQKFQSMMGIGGPLKDVVDELVDDIAGQFLLSDDAVEKQASVIFSQFLKKQKIIGPDGKILNKSLHQKYVQTFDELKRTIKADVDAAAEELRSKATAEKFFKDKERLSILSSTIKDLGFDEKMIKDFSALVNDDFNRFSAVYKNFLDHFLIDEECADDFYFLMFQPSGVTFAPILLYRNYDEKTNNGSTGNFAVDADGKNLLAEAITSVEETLKSSLRLREYEQKQKVYMDQLELNQIQKDILLDISSEMLKNIDLKEKLANVVQLIQQLCTKDVDDAKWPIRQGRGLKKAVKHATIFMVNPENPDSMSIEGTTKTEADSKRKTAKSQKANDDKSPEENKKISATHDLSVEADSVSPWVLRNDKTLFVSKGFAAECLPQPGGEMKKVSININALPEKLRTKFQGMQDEAESLISVPMIVDGRPLGVCMLSVDKEDENAELDMNDVKLMLQATNTVASGLEIYRQSKQLEADKIEAQQSMIKYKELYERYKFLLRHDGLTGALRREMIWEELPKDISPILSSGNDMALAMLDIDHFKWINDDTNIGHTGGDLVLKMVAEKVNELIKKYGKELGDEGKLFRYGGEEFLATLPLCSKKKANEIWGKIKDEIAAMEIDYKGKKIRVTISIGIISIKEDYDPTLPNALEDAIEKADKAMYAAKVFGRNERYVYNQGVVDKLKDEEKRADQEAEEEARHKLIVARQAELQSKANTLMKEVESALLKREYDKANLAMAECRMILNEIEGLDEKKVINKPA